MGIHHERFGSSNLVVRGKLGGRRADRNNLLDAGRPRRAIGRGRSLRPTVDFAARKHQMTTAAPRQQGAITSLPPIPNSC